MRRSSRPIHKTVDARRRARGFTLTELAIVMVVIATIAAIGAPRYSRSLARYRVESAARRVVADLDLARSRAMSTNASQPFVVSGNTYSLPGVMTPGKSTVAYVVNLAVEPYGVEIRAKFVNGADQDVVFDVYGAADSIGEIKLESDGLRSTVILDARTGRATIQ